MIGQDSALPPTQPSFRHWTSIAWTFVACILTVCLSALLFLLADCTVVSDAILKLAWALTPWGHLPTVLTDQAVIPLSTLCLHGGEVFIEIVEVFSAAVCVFLLHLAVFYTVAAIFRIWGWPQYGSEVSWGGFVRPALARFAWRAIWILPVVLIIGALLEKLGWCLAYAGYPLLPGYVEVNGNSVPYESFNIAAVVIGYAWISARVVRSSVIAAIGPEQRRCDGCAYLLRGLESTRCPECGERFQADSVPTFGLGRRRPLRSVLKYVTYLILPALLVLAPVWASIITFSLPLEHSLFLCIGSCR